MGNAIPTQVRKDVRARDNDQCVVCGGRGTDLHHRQRRRDGGHARTNIILLCRDDHAKVHANPEWARERGLIVSAYSDSARYVPVRTFAGWVLLDPFGGLLTVPDVDIVPGDPPQWRLNASKIETGTISADRIIGKGEHLIYNPPPEAVALFEGDDPEAL